MRDIQEFKLDETARKYGPKTKIALHGSHPAAMSMADIAAMSGRTPNFIQADLPLSYAPSLGSLELRTRLAEMHSTDSQKLTHENVIITPGSIAANHLALSTICARGEHVICQFPTYGPLYLLPKHLGAEVDCWIMREERSWELDVNDLKKLIRPNTKAIILNTPNNPTGGVISTQTMECIVDIAKHYGIVVMVDEVFRPLFHTEDIPPPSIVSTNYEKTVATGSMSKSYSLPGIRVGWVISPDPSILRQVINARDYTTLNVSRVDDAIALAALDPVGLPKLIDRNSKYCRRGIELIEEFVRRNPDQCRWVPPAGAGTAFVRILGADGAPVDDKALADRLIDDTGVSIIPGSYCFDEPGVGAGFKGYVRLNLGQREDILSAGLAHLEEAIRLL